MKTVDKIIEQFTRANKALNDLPAVKSTKEIAKKIANFMEEWFG